MTIAIQHIEREMRDIIPRVLRDWPPKVIAKLVNATPRAAKAWKEGDCLPQAVHITALEMALPELASEMRRLRAMPGTNATESDAMAMLIADRVEQIIAERTSQKAGHE